MTPPRVALFRSVNVGGRNRLSMDGLRGAVTEAGWTDVVTYKASGNLVGRAPKGYADDELRALVQERLGVDVPVLLRDGGAFCAQVDGSPFSAEDPAQLHATLLESSPTEERAAAFRERLVGLGEDEAHLVDDIVYLRLAGRYSDSPLSNAWIERQLGVTATTRNWTTMLALAELVRARS